MKKSTSFVLATILSLASFQTSFAKTNDVTGDGIHYVRVTKQGDQVKFEECFKGSNPECIRTLGPKTWYSVAELKSQRTTETIQAYGSVVADIGLFAVSIYGGAVGGAVVFQGASTGAGIGGFISGVLSGVVGGALGAGAGATATTAIVATVRALNPVEQFKQSTAISNKVITDQPVETGNMNKFVERLTLVLEKL